MAFEKLQEHLRSHSKPVEDVDMKKASMIRREHPKYASMGVHEMMDHPIWNSYNTNGIRSKSSPKS